MPKMSDKMYAGYIFLIFQLQISVYFLLSTQVFKNLSKFQIQTAWKSNQLLMLDYVNMCYRNLQRFQNHQEIQNGTR